MSEKKMQEETELQTAQNSAAESEAGDAKAEASGKERVEKSKEANVLASGATQAEEAEAPGEGDAEAEEPYSKWTDPRLRSSLQLSCALRTMAGLYLLYVEYGMFQTRDLNGGLKQLVSYGFMAVFAVAAVLFLYTGIRGLKRLHDEGKKWGL